MTAPFIRIETYNDSTVPKFVNLRTTKLETGESVVYCDQCNEPLAILGIKATDNFKKLSNYEVDCIAYDDEDERFQFFETHPLYNRHVGLRDAGRAAKAHECKELEPLRGL